MRYIMVGWGVCFKFVGEVGYGMVGYCMVRYGVEWALVWDVWKQSKLWKL